jgi:hypothetical protein
MSETQEPYPVMDAQKINRAACWLFAGCVAAGASVWLESWSRSHWLTGGPLEVRDDLWLWCFFTVGIASGLAVPRRFWACPPGIWLGFWIAGWAVCGGEPMGLDLLFLAITGIKSCIVSFVGAAAGALLGHIGRELLARRPLT